MVLYPEKRPDDEDNPIEVFAMNMLEQMRLYADKQKINFQDMSVDQLIQLLGKKFQQKLQNVSKLNDSEIEMEMIHLACYHYFVWSQVRFRSETNG